MDLSRGETQILERWRQRYRLRRLVYLVLGVSSLALSVIACLFLWKTAQIASEAGVPFAGLLGWQVNESDDVLATLLILRGGHGAVVCLVLAGASASLLVEFLRQVRLYRITKRFGERLRELGELNDLPSKKD